MAIKYLDSKRIRGSSTASVSALSFENDFGTTGDWTKVGTTITVDDHVADKCSINDPANSSSDRVHRALGVTLSDTNWLCTFELNVTSTPSAGGRAFPIQFSSTTGAYRATHDSLAVRLGGSELGGGAVGIAMSRNDGGSVTHLTDSSSIVASINTLYYVKFYRESGSLKIAVFTGSDYATGQVGSTQTHQSLGSPTGLSNIVIGSDDGSTGGFNATIDNVKVYNGTITTTTTQDDKTAVITSGVDGTWSAGGALASNVTECASGGNSSDAIIMGGYNGSSSLLTTQEYNGTAWGAGGNLSAVARSTCGGGNSSDAIIMNGRDSSNNADYCQEYNGTSWSDGGNPNTDRHNAAGDGNSSDAICVGGSPSQSETYDGTSWTDIPEVTGRENFAAGGSSTSAICMGATVKTETWNGSSWTTAADMTQANGSNEGGGLPTDAITIGGTTDSDMVEKYNGTAWAAVDLLATGRGDGGGKGNNVNAFCTGGGSTSTEERTSTPTITIASAGVENTIYEETDTYINWLLVDNEWVKFAYTGLYQAIVCGGALNESPFNTCIISSGEAGGAWTTATNMSDSIWNFGGGMADSGRNTFMIFGGHNNTSGDNGELNTSYKFNGETWASGGTMPHKHNGCTNGGGSASGAFAAGGRQGGQQNHSSKYDGSSWTSAGSMNINVMNTGGDGTNTSFLRVGGRGSGNTQNPTYDQASVESHNGSSWSAQTSIGTAIAYHIYLGNPSSGINIGGAYNYTKTDDVTTYNGSTWSTSASDLPIDTSFLAGGSNDTGAELKCMVWGGSPDSGSNPTDKSYQWDGTSWTEKNALTYAANGQAGGLSGL